VPPAFCANFAPIIVESGEFGLVAKIQILGWVLFIVSACGFIASSIRSGDSFGLFGGLFFLLACFVFLVPYALPRGRE
jgi:hypothetical protein